MKTTTKHIRKTAKGHRHSLTAFCLAAALLTGVAACTEEDFDSKYEDPSKVSSVTISKNEIWNMVSLAITVAQPA